MENFEDPVQQPRRIVRVRRRTLGAPSAAAAAAAVRQPTEQHQQEPAGLREVMTYAEKYGYVDPADSWNTPFVLQTMAQALGVDTTTPYTARELWKEIHIQHHAPVRMIARADFPPPPSSVGTSPKAVAGLVDWAMGVYRMAGVLRPRNGMLRNWTVIGQRGHVEGLRDEVRRVTKKYREPNEVKIPAAEFLSPPLPKAEGQDHTYRELLQWVMDVYVQAQKDRTQREVLERIRALHKSGKLSAPELIMMMVRNNVQGGEQGVRAVTQRWVVEGCAGPTIAREVASSRAGGVETVPPAVYRSSSIGEAPLPSSSSSSSSSTVVPHSFVPPRVVGRRSTASTTVSRHLFPATPPTVTPPPRPAAAAVVPTFAATTASAAARSASSEMPFIASPATASAPVFCSPLSKATTTVAAAVERSQQSVPPARATCSSEGVAAADHDAALWISCGHCDGGSAGGGGAATTTTSSAPLPTGTLRCSGGSAAVRPGVRSRASRHIVVCQHCRAPSLPLHGLVRAPAVRPADWTCDLRQLSCSTSPQGWSCASSGFVVELVSCASSSGDAAHPVSCASCFIDYCRRSLDMYSAADVTAMALSMASPTRRAPTKTAVAEGAGARFSSPAKRDALSRSQWGLGGSPSASASAARSGGGGGGVSCAGSILCPFGCGGFVSDAELSLLRLLGGKYWARARAWRVPRDARFRYLATVQRDEDLDAAEDLNGTISLLERMVLRRNGELRFGQRLLALSALGSAEVPSTHPCVLKVRTVEEGEWQYYLETRDGDARAWIQDLRESGFKCEE